MKSAPISLEQTTTFLIRLVIPRQRPQPLCEDKASTTKSERCRLDAQAAEGLGTACTRADERVEAAMGIVQSALTQFETCSDVSFGGVLARLPALSSNGLFSGRDKHLSLPAGFYSALHILTVLGFMALAIRRLTQTGHQTAIITTAWSPMNRATAFISVFIEWPVRHTTRP